MPKLTVNGIAGFLSNNATHTRIMNGLNILKINPNVWKKFR